MAGRGEGADGGVVAGVAQRHAGDGGRRSGRGSWPQEGDPAGAVLDDVEVAGTTCSAMSSGSTKPVRPATPLFTLVEGMLPLASGFSTSELLRADSAAIETGLRSTA